MRAPAPIFALALSALAAAGCVVSTSEFKPRTDEICAAENALTKACGYRCVSVEDPATGCGTPGDCQPCAAPAEAHMVSACASGACAAACAPGWADCNGSSADGCEIDLQGSDAAHCGNCTHSCGTGACVAGVCSATQELAWIGALPTVMAQDAAGGTILYALVSPDAATTTVGVTSQVCKLGGACVSHPGRVTALAVSGGTWWFAATSAPDVAVVELPPSGPAVVTTVAREAYSLDGVEALLVTSLSRVVYTTHAQHQDPSGPRSNLHVLAPGGTPVGVSVAGTAGAPLGIGGIDPFYFVGTPDEGGTLYRYEDLSPISQEAPAVRTSAAVPARIAGWSDGAGSDFLFWAAQGDGSVWRAALATDGSVGPPERIYRSGVRSSRMAMVSDADGVYWCDHGTGLVTRWRAADGAVYHLGLSNSPHGLATDAGGRVYWSDDLDGKIYRAFK